MSFKNSCSGLLYYLSIEFSEFLQKLNFYCSVGSFRMNKECAFLAVPKNHISGQIRSGRPNVAFRSWLLDRCEHQTNSCLRGCLRLLVPSEWYVCCRAPLWFSLRKLKHLLFHTVLSQVKRCTRRKKSNLKHSSFKNTKYF